MVGESNPSVDKQLFDLAQGGLSSPSTFEDWTTQYPYFKQIQTNKKQHAKSLSFAALFLLPLRNLPKSPRSQVVIYTEPLFFDSSSSW